MGLCQMGRQFCENFQCFQVKANLLGVFNHVTMILVQAWKVIFFNLSKKIES